MTKRRRSPRTTATIEDNENTVNKTDQASSRNQDLVDNNVIEETQVVPVQQGSTTSSSMKRTKNSRMSTSTNGIIEPSSTRSETVAVRDNIDNIAQPPERVVPEHIRVRQRAVAQREAARLARPDQRPVRSLAHADRKRSAVASTPFGIFGGSTSSTTATSTSIVGNERIIDGLKTSEWCGPFSLARQMIAKREEAKRLREIEDEEGNAVPGREVHPLDEVMIQVEKEQKSKHHPSLQWKGRNSNTNNNSNNDETKGMNLYTKRQKRVQLKTEGTSKVPTLFTLCVNYIVDNFENVECLGTAIDNSIRTSIAKELVANCKLNGMTFPALAEEGIEVLEIVDCADITQLDLSTRLKILIPAGLKYLILDQAGRCVGPKSVQTIIDCLESSTNNNSSSSSSSNITTTKNGKDTTPAVAPVIHALSIGGAYLLTDIDASRLIDAASKTGLTSLEFKACPLLGPMMLTSIRECFQSSTVLHKNGITPKLMDLSLEDLTWLDSTQLEALVTNPSSLQHLRGLSLRRIGGLTDDIVSRLLEITTHFLQALDLSNNHELTDLTLAAIRRHGSRLLRSLRLNGLRQLTASGLEAAFMFIPPTTTTTTTTTERNDNNKSIDSMEHNFGEQSASVWQEIDNNPPPMLRRLDLGNCYHEAVTDEVLHQVTLAATVTGTLSTHCNDTDNSSGTTEALAAGRDGGISLVSGTSGLVSLNIQGSTLVTDTTLEQLVATSSDTLVELNVSFCPTITNQGLGYLVDNCGTQLSNVQIWGNAQITDEFLDGNKRVNDPDLMIVGGWIKK